MSRYQVTIDSTLCSGLAACLDAAPGAIALGRDGIARPTALASDDERVLEAAAACPMGAIAVVDLVARRQVA